MFLSRVTWSVDDIDKKVSEVDDDTGELPSRAYDFTYTAVGVGKHTIKVQVDYYYSPGPGTKTVAAIGGPLALGASGPSGNPNTFTHDQNNSTKPIYLQYFDYSHASPPRAA